MLDEGGGGGRGGVKPTQAFFIVHKTLVFPQNNMAKSNLAAWCTSSDVVLEPRLVEMLGMHRKKAWESVAGGGIVGGGTRGEIACSPEGLDLLDRMLCYDHQVTVTVTLGRMLCFSFL